MQNKKYLTIKEASVMWGVSKSSLYELIKDPSFPVRNVGLKKKFIIDLLEAEKWFKNRTQIHLHIVPHPSELLKKYGGC